MHRPTLAGTLCTLSLVAACSAPTALYPVAVPGTANPERLLDGVWDVRRSDGSLDAIIVLDRGTMQAQAGESDFRGSYTLTAHDDASWTLILQFDSAVQQGVNTQMPAGYTEAMVVIVTGSGLLYALEPGGAWTRWTRMDTATVDAP